MKDNLITSRFVLRKNKSINGVAPIRLLISLDGKKSEMNTSLKCKVSIWDKHNQRPKGSSVAAKTLAFELEQFKLKFVQYCNKLQQKYDDVTIDLIKETINKKELKHTLVFAIDSYIQHIDDLRDIEFSYATLKKYRCLKRKVIAFLKHSKRKKDIDLEALRFPFILKFEKYLKAVDGIGHNTTVKYIQFLNASLRYAIKNQWLSKFPFEGYKCTFQQTHRESLTEIQITQLKNQKFEKIHLEEIRDIFIFCCYTGLAHIDVFNLTEDNLVKGIDGKLWIYTKRQKTDSTTQVPLLMPALMILEKYKDHPHCVIKDKLLPVRSNQKMNLGLKSIAEACDIKIPLSMHIARHTFATTVLLNNDVPIVTVSKLLGHKQLATTQIYAKVMKTKISKDMQSLEDKLFTKEEQKSEDYGT